jgi:hypothetical protein
MSRAPTLAGAAPATSGRIYATSNRDKSPLTGERPSRVTGPGYALPTRS